MTEPHRAVIARLSADFAAISQQLARVSADLSTLDWLLSVQPPVSAQSAVPVQTYWPPYQPHYAPPPPTQPVFAPIVPPPTRPRDHGWIGKLLAVAGVAVTLIGVVLLLVLAAQAGILRPEIRVGAGTLLAAALVAAATWLHTRSGGRVGAIALAATGIAAAYMDVIAVTTIYHWVPAPVGLIIAAAIGGGGLAVSRRWSSEELGVLVFVPLIVLAPVVTGGITLLLVGFMLALCGASLPVQLGKDWIWLHCARTAASTLPLLLALVVEHFGDGHNFWLAGTCGIAAVLAVTGALVLLPATRNRVLMALLTATGVLPVLCAALAVDEALAAVMAAALTGALLTIVLIGERLTGPDPIVRQIWAVLSAVSALVAVLTAFDGEISAPLLLAMAVVVGVAGRRDRSARLVSLGFAGVGGAIHLTYAWPTSLMAAARASTDEAVSTSIASILLIACAAVFVWSSSRDTVAWASAGVVAVYAITTFTVTVGVLAGGPSGGFFAGHMAATICWIALAAALFSYAARVARSERSLPIGGGLALVAAAMAKLFLFDLGTLDGIFRVAVFIVVGLVLLGMGAGYARLLDKQDRQQEEITAKAR
jgi:Predicted membrane protein (DUF2339)